MPLSRFYRLYSGIFSIEKFKRGDGDSKVDREMKNLLKGAGYGS